MKMRGNFPDTPSSQMDNSTADIVELEADYPDTLNAEFGARRGDDVTLEGWGTTTKDFLAQTGLLATSHLRQEVESLIRV
ncbi:hypothetical protein [Serratia rhizosphaerae]|uniref:Uncharacterized protein n=1 Tax=Serratia rhizosphaerae TaxID=2597702 RepID=A0ABX6GN71_9GAMM|nr:hypothetical protein [Serratia rhizosphaerae]QHA87664.1 hypothetical protein FO014_12265 [Serratia rhizosphaerae]